VQPRRSGRQESLIVFFLGLALALFVAGCAGHRNPDVAGPPDAAANGHADTGTPPGAHDSDDLAEMVGLLDEDDPEAAEPLDEPTEVDVVEEDIAPTEDPSALVAEALEACETARELWEQGEIEASFTTLDRAYSLLLELPADDPDLGQARQDLRHLISRRIVEIYRSRLTSAADLGSPIPLETNTYVENEIRSFQGAERSFFLESYRRSGAYRPMIVRMLKDQGLPEELSWLPLVESGFKTRALSRARAMGMWQFISSTGYRYGLSRSEWVDERMDPEKSTRAAIAYLTELHGMFGDWMTALASYNCGEQRVMSVIMRQEDEYLDRFWDVFERLPRETARYVPRFLATLLIVRDPEKYGFELPEPVPPVGFETVSIDRHVKLEDLDRELGLDKGTLVHLNPELRRSVTPGEVYELKVPPAAAPTFYSTLAELPAYVPPKDTYVVHRVRRGETLSTIARRYGSSVNAIVRANNLRSRNRIQVGQRLKVPSRGARVTSAPPVAASGDAPSSVVHRVRAGDNLWTLASRYGTTVDRIKRDNGLRGERLYVGQSLRINSGIPPGARTYAVRRGDTVAKIAAAHGRSIQAVLRVNGLSSRSTIYPGQILVIPD